MKIDPRTPVLIGGGQWTNRVDRGEPPVEPTSLVAGALERAAEDSGAGSRVLTAADSVRIVQMLSWRYTNVAAVVADLVGASPSDTAMTPMGGNEPQAQVNQACRDIATGQADVVLIGGAEAWRSRQNPGGKELGWTLKEDRSDPAVRMTAEEAPLHHPYELSRQIFLPAQLYPLFEQAYRGRKGRSVEEHMVEVSELWSRFSSVAASNPHAWTQQVMTPEEIRTPSPSNRWISWPYTKVMNANQSVEQGAALIVTSAERAEALGVPHDRWIFCWAGTEAHDHYAISHRDSLGASPAIRLAGRRLFELTGVGPSDVAHADLYSCFPSAVQIAFEELGLPDGLDLTVTGGLAFAGGPWNNYDSHAIATMLDVLRSDPGSLGLVTANGGFLTKHAMALYSTSPPPSPGFQWDSPQDEVDRLPQRELCEDPDGAGEIETWVVAHDREGQPERAIAAVLLDDGSRAWAESNDASSLAELVSGDEQIGRSVKVTPDGTLEL